MSEEDRALAHARVDDEVRIQSILGGAMLMGVVIVTGAFAFILSQRDAGQGAQNLEILGLLAPLLAVTTFFAAFIIGPVLARAPEGASLDERAQRLRAATLVRLALHEGAALFGAVSVFMTGVWMPAGIAIAIGGLGLLLSLPRRAQVEAALLGDRM